MENHKEINLSQLREYIIRYGAKCMERYESDLFYDCKAVEKMCPGQTVLWMVSEMHTHTYSVAEIVERNLDVNQLWGDRCNFMISCTKIEPYDAPMESKMYFDMERVWGIGSVLDTIKKIKATRQ